MTELETHGFTASQIAIVLFEAKPPDKPRGLLDWMASGGIFGDTMDQSDGISLMDGMTVGASIGALWGVVWGSRLALGPIAWGFFGILGGGLVGLIFDRIVPEKRRAMYETRKWKGLIQVEVATPDQQAFQLAKGAMHRSQPSQFAELPD